MPLDMTVTLAGTMRSDSYLSTTRSFAIDGNYAYVGAAGTDSLTTLDISKCVNDLEALSLTLDLTLSLFYSLSLSYSRALSRLLSLSLSSHSPLSSFTLSLSLLLTLLSLFYQDTTYYSSGTTSGSATYLYYGACASYVGSTGSLDVMDGIGGVEKQGDYIYTIKPHGTFTLAVVDVSTPASPTVVGSVTDSSSTTCYYFVISGNYAYAASYGSHALIVVDISTPTAPTIAGRLQDSTNLAQAFNVAVSGNSSNCAYPPNPKPNPNPYPYPNPKKETTPTWLHWGPPRWLWSTSQTHHP